MKWRVIYIQISNMIRLEYIETDEIDFFKIKGIIIKLKATG